MLWLTTNGITTLLTNQGQSLTIYNSLWCSVTVINTPLHDYTLSYSSTVDYDQHDSCIGVKRLLTIYNKMLTKASAHVRESGFGNPWNFCVWNLESWALECGIKLNESGILLRIGIQFNVPLEKTGIRNPRRGIQNPRLSWIPLHETKSSTCQKLLFTYLLNATSFHQS